MHASIARVPPVAADASLDTLRAWSIRRGAGIGGLQQVGQALAPLQGNQVRVRMHAAALNHRDLMVARGLSGRSDRAIVPLSDGAGEVAAVGPEVRALRVGDRVASSFFPDWIDGPPADALLADALGGSLDGVLAQQVVLPENAWVPIPEGLDYATAASLPCAGLTAWHALFELDALAPGSTVLLLGTGGVSVWALQLAKAAGLRVIITSSDEAKLARARALGADATINYRQTPEWGAAARELAGAAGVDRVLEIGGPDTVAQSVAAVRTGGTIAVIGRLTGTAPAQFDPAALFAGAKRMQGLMVGSRAMAQRLARFVDAAGIEAVIDRRFPFDQAVQAFEYLAAGEHFGKVVIEIG